LELKVPHPTSFEIYIYKYNDFFVFVNTP
jgi:hypothetical protein